jgi:rubrerythrin
MTTENDETTEESEDTAASEETHNERLPKRKDVYKCPQCGNKFTAHVKLSAAPTCQNPKVHTSNVVVMELIK